MVSCNVQQLMRNLIKPGICLFVSCFWLMAGNAYATCYRVVGVHTGAGAAPLNRILPGEGVSGSWTGACDTCGGTLDLPNVINVTNSNFQPNGSLMEASVVPFTRYGRTSGYDPEYVFFRCHASDAVYEMYSTNGDDQYAGWYSGGTSAGQAVGLVEAYRTALPDVLLRVTNQQTGQYFSHIWKERRLSRLDVDRRGFVLVKAKNLAAIQVELFRANSNGYFQRLPTVVNSYAAVNAYIAIKGPGLSYPNVGQTHYGNWAGFYQNWPGAISLYNRITLRRYPTCAVINVTPTVFFPSISARDVSNGLTRRAQFNLEFHCQNNAVSGTNQSNTAIGIWPSGSGVVAARKLGLIDRFGGLSHILSNQHGQPGMAKGVGVRVYRNGSPMNLLSSRFTGSGTRGGWHPVIAPNQSRRQGPNNTTVYTESYEAVLERIPNEALGVGRVSATAQVLIRVQ